MTTTLSIELLDSNKEIEEKVNATIINILNKEISKGSKSTNEDLLNLIIKWIREQPEIDSLRAEGVQNSLNATFGLLPGQASVAINHIIKAVAGSIVINIKKFDKNYKGGINFYIQPEDFNNLLALNSGYIQNTDQALPWLDWLLLKGDSVIIVGYTYIPTRGGRSGGGIMGAGSSWRVDPRFSGTANNNFITRALSGREREIQKIFEIIFSGIT